MIVKRTSLMLLFCGGRGMPLASGNSEDGERGPAPFRTWGKSGRTTATTCPRS